MSADETLGTFEEQVMLAVAHAGADAFGANVRREIEERTEREVAIGAVYATLDRLEAKRMIGSSRPREFNGSRRRFHVTGAGVTALANTRAMRERLWRGINLERLAASV